MSCLTNASCIPIAQFHIVASSIYVHISEGLGCSNRLKMRSHSESRGVHKGGVQNKQNSLGRAEGCSV